MSNNDIIRKDDEIALRTSHEVAIPPHEEPEEEKEIDLLELAMKLWAQRKRLLNLERGGSSGRTHHSI